MIEKWIHIGETGGDPWILPIFSAINAAVQRGRCDDIRNNTRELAIHVSTRLNILPVATERVNSGWRALYAEIQEFQDENVFETGKEAYAMLVNKGILYTLLADIDSFLFETNSCCELMGRLLKELHEHKGEPIKGDAGKFLAKLLVLNGQEKDWFILLDKQRIFFIHNGAPYLAIDITSTAPDLIIMNENIKDFSNSTLSHYPSPCRLYAESMDACLCRCLTLICRKTSSWVVSRRGRKWTSKAAMSGQLSNGYESFCSVLVSNRKSIDIITMVI